MSSANTSTSAVALDDLVLAYEHASCHRAIGGDSSAYLDAHTGALHLVGEGWVDEPAFTPIAERHLGIPDDLLGGVRNPALRFASSVGADIRVIGEIFSSRGACWRFRAWLEEQGLRDGWENFEQGEIRQALAEWARSNGLELTPGSGGTRSAVHLHCRVTPASHSAAGASIVAPMRDRTAQVVVTTSDGQSRTLRLVRARPDEETV